MPIPVPNKIVRSLNSIRSHSGTSEGTIVPYKAYVVVTTLEMEKFRRQAEHAKLLIRFEFIKSRLQFIETEKAAILHRLENSHRGPAIENPVPKLSVAPVPGRVGFKIKY